MGYVKGEVRAICDRCGFEYALSSLKREWTGLMVCPEDWDVRPPELRTPNIRPEGVAVPNHRPDNQTDDSPNETTPNDL